MTSGTSTASSAPSTKTSPSTTEPLRHQPVRSPSDRHSSLHKSKSPSPERVKKARSPTARRPNGDARSALANGGNLSDAETDILSSDEQTKAKGKSKKRPLKRENEEAGDASSPSLANRSEPSRSSAVSRSSSVTFDATDKKERRPNGGGKRENGHAKQPVTKKPRLSTDGGSAASRAQSADAISPQDANGRARQAQSAEPRKRKFSDAHHPSKLEPPRQRLRLDDTATGMSRIRRILSPMRNPPFRLFTGIGQLKAQGCFNPRAMKVEMIPLKTSEPAHEFWNIQIQSSADSVINWIFEKRSLLHFNNPRVSGKLKTRASLILPIYPRIL
jgi:hypothetical protein